MKWINVLQRIPREFSLKDSGPLDFEKQNNKKGRAITRPFPALKPIKPIVDIQLMNTFEK